MPLAKGILSNPLEMLRQHGMSVQEDMRKVWIVTKECYNFDPWNGTLIIMDHIAASLSSYLYTRLQAAILAQTVLALQNEASFQREYFLKIVFMELSLRVLNFSRMTYANKFKDKMAGNVSTGYILKLMDAYFALPFVEQVRDGVQSRLENVLILLVRWRLMTAMVDDERRRHPFR